MNRLDIFMSSGVMVAFSVWLMLTGCRSPQDSSLEDPVSVGNNSNTTYVDDVDNEGYENSYIQQNAQNQYANTDSFNNTANTEGNLYSNNYSADSYQNFAAEPNTQNADQYESQNTTEVSVASATENNSYDQLSSYENDSSNNQSQYSDTFNARATAPVTDGDFINEYTPSEEDRFISNNQSGLTVEDANNRSDPQVDSTSPLNQNELNSHSLQPPINLVEEADRPEDGASEPVVQECMCERDDATCMCDSSGSIYASAMGGLYQIASLDWVGYDYRPEEGVVRIEMVTSGTPQFSLFQNQRSTELELGSHEMVVRFHQTSLRGKLTRGINASEFLSPVSYVRMHASGGYTDVIITLKEVAPLRLYAKHGNLLATFGLAEKFLPWSDQELTSHDAQEMAEDLTGGQASEQLMAQFSSTSDLPYYVSPPDLTKDAFIEAPYNGGQEVALLGDVSLNNRMSGVSSSGNPTNSITDSVQSGTHSSNHTQSYINTNQNYGSRNPGVNNNRVDNSDYEIDSKAPIKNVRPSNYNYDAPYNYDEYLNYYESSFVDHESLFDHRLEIIQEVYIQGVAQNTTQDDSDPYEDLLGLQDNSSQLNSPPQSSNPPSNRPNSLDSLDTNKASSLEVSTPSFPSEEVSGADARANQPDMAGYASFEEADAATRSAPVIHPVNLEFRNAKLTDVIDILGAENNINFVYDHKDFSSKSVTIQLKNVSWTHALRAVLDIYDLSFVELGGRVIKIQTSSQIVKEKQRAETKLLIMRLSYLKASTAMSIVQNFIKQGSSSGGSSGATGEGTEEDSRSAGSANGSIVSMSADEESNSLIIEAPLAELSKIKTLVERLDNQTPQVKIDARIIEIQNSNNNGYGIDWSIPFALDTAAAGLSLGSLPLNFGSKFAISAPGNVTASSLNLRLTSFMNVEEIMMQLNWEERYLDTRILQNTSVIVLDNKKAEISSGFEDNIEIQGTANSQGGVVKIGYKLQLSVQPKVTIDGSVSMNVEVTSDDPVSAAGQNRKATKVVKTHLIRSSGETAAIGGIYSSSTTEGVVALPFLNKLPIVGWLFRNFNQSISKREIVVLITPTIINMGALNNKGTAQMAQLDNQYYNNSYADNVNYTADAYAENTPSQNYDSNANNSYNSSYNNQQYYADESGNQVAQSQYNQSYSYNDSQYENSYNSNTGSNSYNNSSDYGEDAGSNSNAYDYDAGYDYQNPASNSSSSNDEYYDDDSYNSNDADYYSSGY